MTLTLTLLAGVAMAEPLTFRTVDLAGTSTELGVIEPPKVDPAKVLLALPPGPQTREMVEAGLVHWADDMANEGWLVVSPVAPGGTLFFSGSEAHLPALFSWMQATWKLPKGTAYSLLGISNGGISAFRAATLHPTRFRNVTVIPGVAREADLQRLPALKDVRVSLVVGADDGRWVTGSQTAERALKAAGADVTLEVVVGQGHSVFQTISWLELMALITR